MEKCSQETKLTGVPSLATEVGNISKKWRCQLGMRNIDLYPSLFYSDFIRNCGKLQYDKYVTWREK